VTAEILIMNKMAVALAADSAVTFGPREGQKIVKTVNKLFMLSKYQPVAIMIYGNAELNGVPWETIIKTYRRKLGAGCFDQLQDYGKDLMAFLGKSQILFPESRQDAFFASTVYGYFLVVRDEIDEQVKELIKSKGQASDEDIQAIVARTVEQRYEELRKADRLPSVEQGHEKTIIERYDQVIEDIRGKAFEQMIMGEAVIDKLKKIAGALFSKDIFTLFSPNCGVVIAGFGDKEIYPSFVEFAIEGVVNDNATHKQRSAGKIGDETSAVIRAFAQKEMVIGFMEGIEPDLRRLLGSYLETVVARYPQAVADSLGEMGDNERHAFVEELKKFGQGLLDDIQKDLKVHIDAHAGPIMSTVASLPKDELASMAEALVELTSFKRKVSMEAETVGGPTDVAVISKGDGFVWIKRKHYFSPDLNQAFFVNYFRDQQVKGEAK